MLTRNADGSENVSPMGPIVDEGAAAGGELRKIVLRPFRTSTTYANLKRTGVGVFHVTDDVAMIAQAAIGRLDPLPELLKVEEALLPVIGNACRWYSVQVESLNDDQQRTEITASVQASGRLRDFFGLNRGKHAVIEAAILATRLHLTGAAPVLEKLEELQVLVDKTGGPAEHDAMQWVRNFVEAKARAES